MKRASALSRQTVAGRRGWKRVQQRAEIFPDLVQLLGRGGPGMTRKREHQRIFAGEERIRHDRHRVFPELLIAANGTSDRKSNHGLIHRNLWRVEAMNDKNRISL
jgi:hypothetical protein